MHVCSKFYGNPSTNISLMLGRSQRIINVSGTHHRRTVSVCTQCYANPSTRYPNISKDLQKRCPAVANRRKPSKFHLLVTVNVWLNFMALNPKVADNFQCWLANLPSQTINQHIILNQSSDLILPQWEALPVLPQCCVWFCKKHFINLAGEKLTYTQSWGWGRNRFM